MHLLSTFKVYDHLISFCLLIYEAVQNNKIHLFSIHKQLNVINFKYFNIKIINIIGILTNDFFPRRIAATA